MTDERMRILKMVEEGKINAAEAGLLLESMGDEIPESGEIVRKQPMSVKGKKLRILVTKPGSEKPSVNVKIPLRLVKWAERFIPEDAKREMDDQGIDLEEILGSLDELEDESLVDVTDENTGEHVRVYIE